MFIHALEIEKASLNVDMCRNKSNAVQVVIHRGAFSPSLYIVKDTSMAVSTNSVSTHQHQDFIFTFQMLD